MCPGVCSPLLLVVHGEGCYTTHGGCCVEVGGRGEE